MSQELESFRTPVSADAPCGISLEDSQLLAGFDAFRLFGSDTPLPPQTDWRAIRDRALEALGQSHDLRLLAHLGAALLRTDGLEPFCITIGLADSWLQDHWAAVFPLVDDDAILRKNALTCFADRMAIVDAVRRIPFVTNKQMGAYSLRDLELAQGQITAGEGEREIPAQAQIEAALEASSIEQLQAQLQIVSAGATGLRQIAATMQAQGGFESAPDFDPLLIPLSRIQRVLTDHLAHRNGAVAMDSSEDSADDATAGASGAIAVGNIKSRQDAIRAIDAAAAFFRKNEPSSPVPMLLDRAKRLVSKSFLEALEDIAPDGVVQARLVGGIKAEEA